MIEFVQTSFLSAIDSFFRYIGDGYWLPLFLFALLLVLFFEIRKQIFYTKKMQHHSKLGIRQPRFVIRELRPRSREAFLLFFQYPVLVLLILFNPISAYFISRFATGVYWRMFWILLLPAVVAFSFTSLARNFAYKYSKLICVLICLVLIVLSGKFIFTSENYTSAFNQYKLPTEVLAVCDVLTAGSDEVVRAVVPSELASYVRQYDANIYLVFGRSGLTGSSESKKVKRVHLLMDAEVIDIPGIAQSMRFFESNYLVIPIGKPVSEDPLGYGYEFVAETELYLVYRLPETIA